MDEIEDEDLGPKSTLRRMGSIRKQPYFANLRLQLQEQLRSLDTRLETQVTLTSELQDFFRKRAEVELESSRSLDKLAKSLVIKQKELKQKRDQWHLFSVSNCWEELIQETKKQSKERSILAEIYSTHLTARLSYVADDLQRIYKQCREVGIEAHAELLKVLHELHTSTKTFHSYQAEYRQTETKLKVVEGQKAKLMEVIPKEKLEKSKKLKLVEKEIEKRRKKFSDARFNALKAKNEYILCMDAANAAVQKYFVDDLSDLIDCMDLGFYQCISRALGMFLSSQEVMKKSLQCNMDNLGKCMSCLDSRLDKQKFLETNNSAFVMPKKFEFQPPPLNKNSEELDTAEPPELEANGLIRQELEQRLMQLHRRLESLRTESDELWKTLETAETSLLEMLTAKDTDVSGHFVDLSKPVVKQPETLTVKMRADRHETDEFHLMKFRDYMLGTNRIARLQAKYDHIRRVLGETDQSGSSPALVQTLSGPQQPRKVRRKRIGQLQRSGTPRLFGGSLEEYLELTNLELPLVMKSCIRVINLFGLHHQGIFRVSGSQVEINNFKDCFERGEDPLADVTDASDINSVAGVFKLYLRELREPLFPIVYFEQFVEIGQLESKPIFVAKMSDLVKSLPRSVVVVLRYLFAFLNHLSEFSDENMMDPYNLAICFGPTLVPVPEDKDQVQYQNLVNELIKNVIIYAEDIFPYDGGIMYEKYISKEPDEADVGDAPADQSQDELDSEICPSEDESEFMEAVAQFDFSARSGRELSFKKGETITLFSQVSSDWWKGSLNGVDGLVPDKYILLKIRDEDKHDSSHSHHHKSRHKSERKEDVNVGVGRSRTGSDPFLSSKGLSLSLSPSLRGEGRRRLLGAKQPSSPNSFLGVSRDSVALSTSPDSPSEFGSMERNGKGGISRTPAFNCRQHQRSLSVTEESALTSPTGFNVSLWKEALLEEEQQPKEPKVKTEEKPKELPKEEDSGSVHSINMSFSTPKTVENDGAPEEVIYVNSCVALAAPQSPTIKSAINLNNSTQSGSFQIPGENSGSSGSSGGNEGEEIPGSSNPPGLRTNIQFWELRSRLGGHTPDLVMDLPPSDPSGPSTSPSATVTCSGSGSLGSGDDLVTPESPDSGMTAAECFAKQNQCTLKKNSRGGEKAGPSGSYSPLPEEENEEEETEVKKPEVKAKPTVLKKPLFPAQLISPPLGAEEKNVKKSRIAALRERLEHS